MRKLNTPHISDEILFQQFREGNEGAFTELYQRYYSKLLYFIMQSLGENEEAAKDLLQDVFLKVIHKADSYHPEFKFSTWIYTICSNTCKNALKKRSVRKRFLEENAPMEECQQSNTRATINIRKALQSLPPKQKQVFLLRFSFSCSIKEIAEILEVSEGTIKSRLHYCIQNLSKQPSVQSLIQEI